MKKIIGFIHEKHSYAAEIARSKYGFPIIYTARLYDDNLYEQFNNLVFLQRVESAKIVAIESDDISESAFKVIILRGINDSKYQFFDPAEFD